MPEMVFDDVPGLDGASLVLDYVDDDTAKDLRRVLAQPVMDGFTTGEARRRLSPRGPVVQAFSREARPAPIGCACSCGGGYGFRTFGSSVGCANSFYLWVNQCRLYGRARCILCASSCRLPLLTLLEPYMYLPTAICCYTSMLWHRAPRESVGSGLCFAALTAFNSTGRCFYSGTFVVFRINTVLVRVGRNLYTAVCSYALVGQVAGNGEVVSIPGVI